MKIINCRTDHKINPLGYQINTAGTVCVSWQVAEAKGKKQKWARLQVATEETMQNICYDSGENKELDSLRSEIPVVLKPRTRYFWTVTVCSDLEETATSEINWFETGKMEEAWTADWISCDNTIRRHPVFEKILPQIQEVESARLYICGLGLFEAYIDEKKIGGEILAPYSNNYNEWVQYMTYDVTEAINGAEKLSILLGNGWYKARFGFNSGRQKDPKGYYGDSWKLIAELHIDQKDGTHQVIGTDGSWIVRRSKITASSIYDGECRDDTLEPIPAEQAQVCEAPKGELTERFSTPVTVHEQLKPVELIHTPKDEWVFDIGQNIAGIFQMRVHEPRGTMIQLQFGEVLQNGCFYRDNLRTAKAEYVYISDGNETVLRPAFTYYGYRYVKVSGVKEVKAEDFTALALYSELGEKGTFRCGHPLVNQLVQNTRWGLKDNFVDVPTDCPQRDERMGWTGDAQVFSATASYLEESYSFYEKYLHDMATEQKENGGMVPDVIPSFEQNTCSSVWGDAACIIPWNLYLFYGDKSILKQQFVSMKGWVDYITGLEKGKKGAWGEHFHYGDWLALDHPARKADTVMGGTEEAYIAYIYYANSAQIVAKAATVLGEKETAAKYQKLADQIIDYIKTEYITLGGRCAVPTQTGLVLALKYHLSPDDKKLAQLLKKRFEDCDNKLQTGFTGTPLLCGILSENGLDDLAFQLLLNEEYPGWLHEIKLGATTVWERWNSINDDGSISSTGMNSLNHYSYGSIVEWLFRYVAGIAPVEAKPGFRMARLQPRFRKELKYVDVQYRSAAGAYAVKWEILDAVTVKLHVSVPFGAEAELVLPEGTVIEESGAEEKLPAMQAGTWKLPAGNYDFTYKLDERIWKVLSIETPLGILMKNNDTKRCLHEVLDGGEELLPVFVYQKSLEEVLHMYVEQVQADAMLDAISVKLEKLNE